MNNFTIAHFVIENDIPAGVSIVYAALGQKIVTQAKIDLHPGDECVVRLSDAEMLVIKHGDDFIIYPAARKHLTEDFYKGLGTKWTIYE